MLKTFNTLALATATLTVALGLVACANRPWSVLTRPAAHEVAQVVKPAETQGAVVAQPVANPRPFGDDPQPVAAWQMQIGTFNCQDGLKLTVQDVSNGQYRVSVSSGGTYTMKQVSTKAIGIVRLDDVDGNSHLMQAATETMVFDDKKSRRLATECQSPAQKAYKEFIQKKGGLVPVK